MCRTMSLLVLLSAAAHSKFCNYYELKEEPGSDLKLFFPDFSIFSYVTTDKSVTPKAITFTFSATSPATSEFDDYTGTLSDLTDKGEPITGMEGGTFVTVDVCGKNEAPKTGNPKEVCGKMVLICAKDSML